MTLTVSTRRRALAVAALLAVLAVLGVFASPSVSASPAGNCTWYSNASHTTVVGQLGYDCCNNYINWGIRTKYYVCSPACFICYPPPRD